MADALSDYMDLRVAVVDAVGRSDIADILDRSTLFAEGWLSRNLRHRKQITPATVTMAAGVGALPGDFSELLHAYDEFGSELKETDLTSQHGSGIEGSVSISGSSILRNGYSGALKIEYYAEIPTLTTSATATNWLLADYPELYVYAVASAVAKHVRDVELVKAMQGLRDNELAAAQSHSALSRYSRGVVRLGGVIA